MCSGMVFKCAMRIIMLATLVIGVVVIIVGAVMASYLNNYGNELIALAEDSINGDLFKAAVYMMLPVGTLLIISGVFGCLATKKQGCNVLCCADGSLCLLIFIIATICIAVLVITSGILASAYKNSLDTEALDDTFTTQCTEKYNLTSEMALSASWDEMQYTLKCCGSTDYTDYRESVFRTNTGYNIPASCCVAYNFDQNFIDYDDYQTCNDTSGVGNVPDRKTLHLKGCADEFQVQIESDSDVVAGVCYSFGICSVISLVVAIFIRNRLEEKTDINTMLKQILVKLPIWST